MNEEAITGNSMPDENKASQRNKKRISRRTFITVIIGVVLCFYLFYPSKPPLFKTKKKIVILGFDGTDPGLVRRWIGELPNLRKLKQIGFSDLQSSNSPESPVAWSCFAVGANPGKHGVFDFLRRPKGTYTPSIESFMKQQYPEFMFKTLPVQMPKAILRRGGTAFWDVLSDHGIPTTMIEVPVTFPPPKLSYGRSLSGLGIPDIRGMEATFHHFVYDSTIDESAEAPIVNGGKVELLSKEGESHSGFIWGPNDPVIEQEIREKDKKLLELKLSEYEWEAHIYTLQRDHASETSKLYLSDKLNTDIYGKMAYFDYLQDQSFEERADRIRKYLSEGDPIIKQEGATASNARENLAKIRKQTAKLNTDVNQLNKPIKIPIEFKLVGKDEILITVGDESQTVKLLEWSDCFTVYIPITSLLKYQAICRFYPQELKANSIKVFMTSPEIDPRNPSQPISHPESYSKELAEWMEQPYKTRGWAAETGGLKEELLEEDGFISDLNYVMDMREKKLFETWDRTLSNVFVSVFSATDRVAHMFYRFLDEKHPMYDPIKAVKYENTIKDIYIRMDKIVGKMLKKLENEPDTTLFVMSDHGFSSWRYQLHINNWLIENGFMILKGQIENSDLNLVTIAENQTDFFSFVDWRQTKAYAMGLGQIYINLEGREPVGVVKQDEYEGVCSDIITKLEQFRDTRDGVSQVVKIEDDPYQHLGGLPVVHYVKHREEIWPGPYCNDDHDCPDLQVGFYPGYRVSWQTCLGGISVVDHEEIGKKVLGDSLEDNMETWSGDHCSLSRDYMPGMVFCNRPIRENPSIYDFAPTVLEYFGLKKPPEMEGKNLLDT